MGEGIPISHSLSYALMSSANRSIAALICEISLVSPHVVSALLAKYLKRVFVVVD